MNNTDMPLVSVIMGVYNTEIKYLKKAVESILTQTYDCLEFVIVDDGNTKDEIKAYLNKIRQDDKRVKLIINDNNIGLTRSLNRAIENSTGKYIARMDSDDISLPERILKQTEYMEGHPEVCMTGTNTLTITDEDEAGKGYCRGHMSDQRVCEIHLLYENEGYAHPTFMLRRSFLDEHSIRYRENMKRDQDFGMTTDCILAGGRRYLIEEPLLKYRVHPGQISSTAYSEQVECQAMIGFDRLRQTFTSLSDEECHAISRINHERQDYQPDLIISAIKKIISENREKQLFDKFLLEREFRYEYYRKAMRITRINGRPWGIFKLFYISSIPAVVLVKCEDRIRRIKANLRG